MVTTSPHMNTVTTRPTTPDGTSCSSAIWAPYPPSDPPKPLRFIGLIGILPGHGGQRRASRRPNGGRVLPRRRRVVSGFLLDEKRKVTIMLVLTKAAAEVVKSVTSTPQSPEGAGVRIASAAEPEDPGALRLTAATHPGENDQVIEAAGARVFVEPQAAAYLEDKVLDAQLDEQGTAYFSLGSQDPGQP
jgi:Fe-S cluster assembly iron-binding protein IscA